jgi:hypothetical protein
MDKFLRLTWAVGCWLQKAFGAVDEYYAAESWADALNWLARKDTTYESIQYWGHGSAGTVWLASQPSVVDSFAVLIPRVRTDTLIWFRTCSTFQGASGQNFSGALANLLKCTVAGHTRIIGVLQGGLHTRRPGEPALWPLGEAEFPPSLFADLGLKWGNNTVTCLATKVPPGW